MRNVTGISLYVYKYEDNEAHVLTFRKADSKVIDIGRKSAHPKGKSNTSACAALFRCPVISRRHAKITFTDYGSVHIVDLSSHHGTHVLQDGDTVSTMIEPQVPKTLSDGDVVTFGKSVGRDETLVRPVIARVSLLFGTTPSPESSPAPPILRQSNAYSGRFGVYPHSSSSNSSRSSSPSSPAEGDSDVEEIPRPSGAFPSRQQLGCAVMGFTRPNYRRFNLLRRILPRIDTLEEEEIVVQEGVSHTAISVSSTSPSPDIIEISPNREPSVTGSWADSLSSSRRSSPGPVDVIPPVKDLPINLFEEATPAAAEIVASPVHVDQVELDIPVTSDAEGDEDQDNAFQAEQNIDEIIANLQSFNEVFRHRVAVPPPPTYMPPPPTLHYGYVDMHNSTVPQIPPASNEGNARPPPPDLFDARMYILKSRLADLEKQLLDEKRDAHDAEERASDTTEAAQVAVRMHEESVVAVANLKEMVKAMEDLRAKSETELAQELKAVRAARAEAAAAAAEAKAHALMIASMRARIEAQAAHRRQHLAHVATETMSQPAVEAEVQVDGDSGTTHDPLTLASMASALKRKRSELDELDDDLHDDRHPSSGVSPLQVDTDHAVVDGGSRGGLPTPEARPMKRRRVVRVMEGVVKTTAIAAAGAVAAWSALAFS